MIAGLHRVGELSRADAKWSGEMTAALADAWAVIDNVWRIYRVLSCFPRLRRTPPVELALRAFEPVGDLRDGIQHMHGELRSKADRPIWGVLSWFWMPDDPRKGGESMSFAAGAMRPGRVPAVNPLGKRCEVPVGLVRLTALDASAELSDLMEKVRQLAGGLDNGFRTATEECLAVDRMHSCA